LDIDELEYKALLENIIYDEQIAFKIATTKNREQGLYDLELLDLVGASTLFHYFIKSGNIFHYIDLHFQLKRSIMHK
jgi:hypothetical protein